MSSILVKPESAFTIIPWPSKKVVVRKRAPSPPSRGVADQDVDLARGQGREPLVGGEGRVLDRVGIAEHRGGHDLAELDVEARVVAPGVDQPEPGHGLVDAAPQRAPVLHLGEQAAPAAATTAALALGAGLALGRVAAAVVVVAAGRAEQAHGDQHGGQSPRTCSSEHRNSPLSAAVANGSCPTRRLHPSR
jgi:hypothetical protein